MSLRELVVQEELEDTRFAVVMTGGVSLAVWTGGVTHEINRLGNTELESLRMETTGPEAGNDDDYYADLLDIGRTTVRVDVITGTSAGGLNGAFLALGIAYGRDLAPLGSLWATRGGLAGLLRGPFEKDPPSLMRGDDYFLPELRSAMTRILLGRGGNDFDARHAAYRRRSVTLLMTTSLMEGEPRRFVDDYGTTLTEIDHEGSFTFVRSEDTRDDEDPFWVPPTPGETSATARIERLAARFAFAARSTASFPFAFEPVRCTVTTPGEPGPDELHPNMHGYANFSGSRFVIDGGVLLNKPVRPALEAIRKQPAGRQVRRILAYVNPDPGPQQDFGDTDRTPRLADVLAASLVTLPAAQSVHRELEDLSQHNRRARDRRLSRTDLLATVGADTDSLACRLFPTYQTVVRRRAVSTISDRLVARVPLPRVPAPVHAGGAPTVPPAWTREEIVAAFEALDGEDPSWLPFVPAGSYDDAMRTEGRPWRWGVTPVTHLWQVAVDVFRRALWLAPLGGSDERRELQRVRRELHGLTARLDAVARDDATFWDEEAETLPDPPPDSSRRPEVMRDWLRPAAGRWPTTEREREEMRVTLGLDSAEARAAELEELAATARAIARTLINARDVLWRTVDLARRSGVPGAPGERSRLRCLLNAVLPVGDEKDTEDACLRRLLALEVCTVVLGGRDDLEQEVDLIEISGETDNSFGKATSPGTKLAGVQLAHFGAFYKRSWRVNDWIWGRLDGATRLTQAVLSPARLRQLQLSGGEALALLRAAAVGPSGSDADALGAQFDAEAYAILEELAFLDDDSRPVPPSLPRAAMVVARRRHLQILREELPNLADSVSVDLAVGAATRTAGVDFRRAYRGAIQQNPGGIPAEEIFDLFRDCEIGSERIVEEHATDLFAGTVSTAAAVTVSAAEARTAGLGPARVPARALRGVVLTLYALIAGMTSSGRFAHAGMSLALAVGGACLAVAFMAAEPAPLLAGIGTTLLVAGLGAAALRARLWQLAAAASSVIVVLGAYATVRGLWGAVWERLVGTPTFLGIVAVVVVFLGVGSLAGKPRWDPEAAITKRELTRHRSRDETPVARAPVSPAAHGPAPRAGQEKPARPPVRS